MRFGSATRSVFEVASFLSAGFNAAKQCDQPPTVLSSVRLDHSGRLIVGSIGSGAKIHTAWAKQAIRPLFPQIGAFDLDYAWQAAQDPDCQAAMRYYEETKCFPSSER